MQEFTIIYQIRTQPYNKSKWRTYLKARLQIMTICHYLLSESAWFVFCETTMIKALCHQGTKTQRITKLILTTDYTNFFKKTL